MEGNIADTLIDGKQIIGCYAEINNANPKFSVSPWSGGTISSPQG